jgi:hypothetical protein
MKQLLTILGIGGALFIFCAVINNRGQTTLGQTTGGTQEAVQEKNHKNPLSGLAVAVKRFATYWKATSIRQAKTVTIGSNELEIPGGTKLYPVRFYNGGNLRGGIPTFFYQNIFGEWLVVYGPTSVGHALNAIISVSEEVAEVQLTSGTEPPAEPVMSHPAPLAPEQTDPQQEAKLRAELAKSQEEIRQQYRAILAKP